MKTPGSKVPGRSWLRGEVSLDEVRSLTKAFGPHGAALFSDDMMQGCTYDVVVVDGPLRVGGDFSSFGENLVGLVVRGDFSVSGVYSDTDDPATGVFVLGNMHAGRVVTTGQLCVKGSLTVDGALVGFYNDYSTEVGGDVITACFVPENHFFRVGGRVRARVVLGDAARFRVPEKLRASITSLGPEEYRTVLVPDVLNPQQDDGEEAEFDYDAFKRRVRKNEPVLLTGASASQPARGPDAERNPVPSTSKKSVMKKSVTKKSPAKKSPAKKSPAKKPAAKQRRR